MRGIRNMIIGLLLAANASAGALAADRETEDFIHRMRSEAAWNGVEVQRIAWDGKTARAYGRDRSGFEVTVERACGVDRIVCPTGGQLAMKGAPESASHVGTEGGAAGQP